ncbi:MAG: DUF2812 domain-containing protein [Oscillospiraceae bacterium]|nr:DUF2812 domain-containing protein [Oscillospiraceae bacterium]
MKSVVWKWFLNFEKEEEWLNTMSAKGFALIDYFFCRYLFQDSAPGEYIYRIELLEHPPTHPESQQYLNFMSENGSECISSWIRWVYFRKRSESGPFDIYSDIDSRIAHYRRVGTLLLCIAVAEFCIGSSLLGVIINDTLFRTPSVIYPANLIVLCVLWGLGAVLLLTWNAMRKKTKKLKQEKRVWE